MPPPTRAGSGKAITALSPRPPTTTAPWHWRCSSTGCRAARTDGRIAAAVGWAKRSVPTLSPNSLASMVGTLRFCPPYKLSRSDNLLRHRIAGARAELACRHPVVAITSRLIEAMRRLGACERAAPVASLHRSGFERAQQGTADAAKSCIGRHIIQRDLACVRHGSHPENGIALDGEQK